jgi:ABC-2 type transport system permease protein
MSPIYLVARRDYLAYVGSWGFWVSLVVAPLAIAALVFGPVLLAHAEPSRFITVIADRPSDANVVTDAFTDLARQQERTSVFVYVAAAAPEAAGEAQRAFDAAPNAELAAAAARNVIARRAPGALRAFPHAAPRYVIARPPAPDIDGVKPYLTGAARPALYGALRIRRDANGAPTIEYWSVNLSQNDASAVAARAMALEMRREALAREGLAPQSADALDELKPALAQFDPRANPGEGPVTLRQRAPFYASIFLSIMLWSVVFSAANMLLGSIVEERSNKILDTVLTSVTPTELLIGKLIAVAAVNATLFLVWGGLSGELLHVAATRASGNFFGALASAFLDPHLIAAFLIGFGAGYLMYGALFLAFGALCETPQDAQQLVAPATLLLGLPMTLIAPALDNPNSPIVVEASWFPLFTPFLLIVRAPTGLSWLEIAAMGALMAATIFLVIRLAARVFRAGVINHASVSSWRKKKG